MAAKRGSQDGAVTSTVTRRREATRDRVRRWRRRRKSSVTASVTIPVSASNDVSADSRADSPFIQEARTYDGIIAAIIKRRTELGLSQIEVDDLAGLQSGYTGKCEKPSTSYGRIMGEMSFRTLLQTLGIKLVIVEIDPLGKLRGHDNVKVGARRRGSKKKGRGK